MVEADLMIITAQEINFTLDPWYLLACNLLVYYLVISSSSFFHFINLTLSLISSLLLFFLVSSTFFLGLLMKVEQPTEDMAQYMQYHGPTEMKNTMLGDEMSQLMNNDNLQEFSSNSYRLGLFILFLVVLIFFSYHYCAVLCGKVILATF